MGGNQQKENLNSVSFYQHERDDKTLKSRVTNKELTGDVLII